MAGTLTISTLSDGTNSTSSTNCIQGSAKAWVNFAGATSTINGSYNVSSITRNAQGDYSVNFTNAMSNTSYSAIATGCSVVAAAGSWPVIVYEYMSAGPTLVRTTSAWRFLALNFAGSLSDGPSMNVAIFR